MSRSITFKISKCQGHYQTTDIKAVSQLIYDSGNKVWVISNDC